MSDGLGFLTAVYRDGRVHIGGKSYPAGTFAVQLLNQYYKDDTAARIAVFRQSNWNVREQLRAGYLNETDFLKAGEEILTILQTLPKLKPFSSLNIAAEKQRIAELFTESNAAGILDYLRRRVAVAKMDKGSVGLGVFPPKYDKALFKNGETMCATVLSTLRFYDTIPEDMRKAFEQLKKFVYRVDEADRFDERHLLPIATEVFGSNPFPLRTEYIALLKRRNSLILVTARRMTFESYYSFVLTDFFEGLHHGHYPRQCELCKQYFLMQSARRQKYCTYGTAPELYHGEKISCRRYAIIQGKAERAKDNPLKAAYDRRCSAIRSEKSRGTISAEFAQAAQELAKRRLERAEEDDAYAKANYFTDLERTKLYADTDKRMK